MMRKRKKNRLSPTIPGPVGWEGSRSSAVRVKIEARLFSNEPQILTLLEFRLSRPRPLQGSWIVGAWTFLKVNGSIGLGFF